MHITVHFMLTQFSFSDMSKFKVIQSITLKSYSFHIVLFPKYNCHII